MAKAIRKGLVLACHDLSEGGLAAALAESAFAGGIGATADVSPLVEGGLSREAALFSESPGRFVIEAVESKEAALEGIFKKAGAPLTFLGKTGGEALTIANGHEVILEERLKDLKDAWQSTFRAFEYHP